MVLWRRCRTTQPPRAPHRPCRPRPGARGAGVFHTANERADGLVMLVGDLTGLGDRFVGRKIAVVDTALEFRERHHRHFFLRKTVPLLGNGSGYGKPSPVVPGL